MVIVCFDDRKARCKKIIMVCGLCAIVVFFLFNLAVDRAMQLGKQQFLWCYCYSVRLLRK